MSEPRYCPRCNGRCYAGEERLALDGQSWHIQCFTCAICNTSLDTRTLAESREENNIFCWNCYRKYFGPAGYGYGVKPALVTQDRQPIRDCYDTSPTPSMESVKPRPKPLEQQSPIPAPSRLGRDYLSLNRNPPPRFYTNQVIVKRQVYRKCSPTPAPLPVQSSRSIHTFQSRNPPGGSSQYRRTPSAPNPSKSRPMSARPSTSRGREYCLKCGNVVFNGPERVLGYRGVYHRSCFVCSSCNKSLDSRTVNEDGGKLYCTGCYKREVGPNGVGFGGGAGILRTP